MRHRKSRINRPKSTGKTIIDTGSRYAGTGMTVFNMCCIIYSSRLNQFR
jgi:hypothetical protein